MQSLRNKELKQQLNNRFRYGICRFESTKKFIASPGGMPWHCRFAAKGYIIPRYRDFFKFLNASSKNKSELFEAIKDLKKAQKNADFTQSINKWTRYLDFIQQQIDENKIDPIDIQTLSSSGYLLHVNFRRMLSFLSNLDDFEVFDKFWQPVTRSSASVDLIPMLMHYLCNQEKFQKAEMYLFYMAKLDSNLAIYNDGVNYGLNTIIRCYFKETQNSSNAGNWRKIYRLMDKIDSKIQISLLPIVAEGFSDHIPSYSYSDFYKLMLSRGIDMSSSRFHGSLADFYNHNSKARMLIEDTYALTKKTDNGDYSLFSKTFLDHMFKRLARTKDAERADLLLEFLTEKNTGMDARDLLRLLLIRCIEFEDMIAVTTVYESMISKGIEPDVDAMINLFRGFRKKGFEQQCWETAKLIESSPALSEIYKSSLRAEILSLLRELYSPGVVYLFYTKFFPDSIPQLEAMNIKTFVTNHGLNGSSPSYEPSQRLTIRNAHWKIKLAPMNILYRAILANLNNSTLILDLYEKYKKWHLEHSEKADMLVIFFFVQALCRVSDSRTLIIADGMFRDAVTSLSFTQRRSSYDTCLALGLLSRRHCRFDNIEKAKDLVRFAEENPKVLKVNSMLINPIIRYHLTLKDSQSVQFWLEYADYHGLELTDPNTAPLLDKFRKQQMNQTTNETEIINIA